MKTNIKLKVVFYIQLILITQLIYYLRFDNLLFMDLRIEHNSCYFKWIVRICWHEHNSAVKNRKRDAPRNKCKVYILHNIIHLSENVLA